MGMNMDVVGIIPPDGEWKKMKSVWDACVSAGVPIPNEVMLFFNNEDPNEKGVVIEISNYPGCVSKYENDMEEGYEVDVTKLPPHVKIIIFYNSY
jgi:hypothetical protein